VTDVISNHTRTYAADEIIVEEGAPGDCMYVVLAGRAGLERRDGGRVEFGPGDFFGEMAVIDAQPRSATVRALENGTRTLPIDQARFIYLVSQQPVFALSIMAGVSQRMRGMARVTAPPTAKGASGFTSIEVMPGLWQMRSRGKASNAYLVAGRDRTILIDTGLPSAAVSLRDAVRATGRTIDDVDLVVLTHEHTDHVGGVPHLPGRPVIAAHPMTANKIELQDAFAMVSGVIGEDVAAFEVGCHLAEGAVIDVAPFRLEVVYTPGHTSSCISLIDPARDVLVSGDTLLAGGALGGIFGSGSISDYVLSLQRLGRLGLNTVLPGHGRASEAGRDDVSLALTRARALLSETRELFQSMARNAEFDRILGSLRELNR
jgi:hydroxyacylglutathione hydrolase